MGDTNGARIPGSNLLRGRERRSQNLSTKLTEAEAACIEGAARKADKSPSEWAREVLLRSVSGNDPGAMQKQIFTELVAVELIMMNALAPLLRGDELSPDQVAQIFHEVQATKAAQARQILLKRSQTGEQQSW